jgi:hypothetical protein
MAKEDGHLPAKAENHFTGFNQSIKMLGVGSGTGDTFPPFL